MLTSVVFFTAVLLPGVVFLCTAGLLLCGVAAVSATTPLGYVGGQWRPDHSATLRDGLSLEWGAERGNEGYAHETMAHRKGALQSDSAYTHWRQRRER